jgi:hypothetical protein
MNPLTIGILLYSADGQMRDAFKEDKYRLLAEQITARKWNVRTLSYHDARRDVVRREALQCNAVLTWINPFEPNLNRAALDALLRELATAGVWVSAHPDTILRIGTKDVLVATQLLAWSVEASALRSIEEFRQRFPAIVRREHSRILKQYRGHSGQGVWKVTAVSSDKYEVRSAARSEAAVELDEHSMTAFFDERVFAQGSHLIEQRWMSTMDRGMVRAYLCGTQVTGFGYQEIIALHPVGADDDFTRQQPSRRYYYTEDCFLFRRLRERLEREWIPALQTLLTIADEELPVLWDADFFFGDPPDAEFLLCEINASCVSPFPDSAITKMITALERRLCR